MTFRMTATDTYPAPGPLAAGSVRLSSVYATSAALDTGSATALGRHPSEFLELEDLAAFYDTSRQQLPAVLGRQELDVDRLAFNRWAASVDAAWVWLFVMPSGGITTVLTVDITGEVDGTTALLEDLHHADLAIGGTSLADYLSRLAVDLDPRCSIVDLEPERHLLVLARPREEAPPSDSALRSVVHHAGLSLRNGHGRTLHRPEELNRRPGSAAAIGPCVSVLVGIPGHVGNAALLTAVQIVSADAGLRRIRRRAHDSVAELRAGGDPAGAPPARRVALERVTSLLRAMELDLSCSVEAVTDLGMIIPCPQAESFHEALTDSLGLARRSVATGHMLERLANAISAELAGVQSAEARAEGARRGRMVAAVTFVTTTVGTLGLLFGFLGINCKEVDPQRSMFDARYLPIYLSLVGIVLGGVILFAVLSARDGLRDRGRGAGSDTR
jgi:hypothetical protein